MNISDKNPADEKPLEGAKNEIDQELEEQRKRSWTDSMTASCKRLKKATAQFLRRLRTTLI